jgi:hypothetical protein
VESVPGAGVTAVKRSPVRSLIRFVSCAGHAYAADGQRLAVMRPQAPALALSIAQTAMQSQDRSLLAELPDGDYAMVGWLGADGASVVDDDGKDVDAIRPGDSFVTFQSGPAPIAH